MARLSFFRDNSDASKSFLFIRDEGLGVQLWQLLLLLEVERLLATLSGKANGGIIACGDFLVLFLYDKVLVVFRIA